MSALTFINRLPATSSGRSAIFVLLDGESVIERVEVGPGAQVSMPLRAGYTVRGERQAPSPSALHILTVPGPAEVVARPGNAGLGFELSRQPATQPGAIVLRNVCSDAVRFTVTSLASPARTTVVVEPFGSATVTAARRWSVYALVDGFVSEPVDLDGTGTTVSLSAGDGPDGHTLEVAGATGSPRALAPAGLLAGAVGL